MTKSAIGKVYTPLEWAVWVVEHFGVLEKWRDGAVVLDPTAGNGRFLEAMLFCARKDSINVTPSMARRIHGVEVEKGLLEKFRKHAARVYKISIPKENLVCSDYLFWKSPLRADVLIGNPPWVNFTNLPDQYKQKLKPLFRKYGLVGARRTIVLGNSRVDIAALVVARALHEHLKENGEAYFYLPLSIFLNDGAHEEFRKYEIGDVPFAVSEIFDFDGNRIFDGISTRYGLCVFRRDEKPDFPISYKTFNLRGGWDKGWARPIDNGRGPLIVSSHKNRSKSLAHSPILEISGRSMPRQGVNTCGEKASFIFNEIDFKNDKQVVVSNDQFKNISLPCALIHPLMERRIFTGVDSKIAKPERYIFIPHDIKSGKPLSPEQLENYPDALNYLHTIEEKLIARRGAMLNAIMKRGYWWALLGVGPYSFAPWKVAWEAYGRSTFRPSLFGRSHHGIWQGNNALHAFMPFWKKADAERALAVLSSGVIENILLSHRMQGSRSWAQPGRIKPFLKIVDE